MKAIEVREQVRLPLGRCLELVLSGLKYRLFRAAITVTIIALAGAFLMVMLTDGFTARQVAKTVAERIAPRETFRFWVARISLPLLPLQLADELASAKPGQVAWEEFATWGHLSAEDLNRLAEAARRHHKYLAYFQNLGEGQRRGLVGAVTDEALFADLADPAKFAAFREALKTSTQQFPTSVEEFQQFLKDWQAAEPARQKILAGDAAAVEQVKTKFLTGAQTPQSLLAKADKNLLDTLTSLGFHMPADILPLLREQAAWNLDAKTLISLYVGPAANQTGADLIGAGEGDNGGETAEEPGNAPKAEAEAKPIRKGVVLVKNLLATRLDVNVTKLNDQMLYHYLTSAEGAKWFVDATACDKKLGLSAKRVQQVAAYVMNESHLEDVKNNVSQVAGSEGLLGFNNRTISLILVSFLVCIVGIANAMLMSVTERFREIATMKCLGATDGFIMINFILESVMQGVAGGAIGVALGFLLGSLRAWSSYGLLALGSLPLWPIVAAAGVALVVSILISAMAAVYPAWVAARLAPMEAMRIE
ncbi:MAG: FtsX-like permease family protein [Phycisphaerae bacterium]|jgi:putative ABC transport system permease protein